MLALLKREKSGLCYLQKNLSTRDFQRHQSLVHRKGFHPRVFCRACTLVLACAYSFRLHYTKKHEHLVKVNLEERGKNTWEKVYVNTNKKFEFRDSVVQSKNGSPIGSYKVVYMKTNGDFILRDFYPNDSDVAIGIRKNDTRSLCIML